eukprot:TRINITY_DN2748_c0_g1::TRINITY_DN2748_c0_g1_i2::g.27414::m.27414 TRINITY_DN2748_c0_g1::TRINITY_DN2748_c0_g1_i2::g.27414  ORF type:complete len:128 (-),score=-3.28,DUF4034/PF13226.1/0.14 TRINITY_DN2748_c0_g1_i2:1103-1486(-)
MWLLPAIQFLYSSKSLLPSLPYRQHSIYSRKVCPFFTLALRETAGLNFQAMYWLLTRLALPRIDPHPFVTFTHFLSRCWIGAFVPCVLRFRYSRLNSPLSWTRARSLAVSFALFCAELLAHRGVFFL